MSIWFLHAVLDVIVLSDKWCLCCNLFTSHICPCQSPCFFRRVKVKFDSLWVETRQGFWLGQGGITNSDPFRYILCFFLNIFLLLLLHHQTTPTLKPVPILRKNSMKFPNVQKMRSALCSPTGTRRCFCKF